MRPPEKPQERRKQDPLHRLGWGCAIRRLQIGSGAGEAFEVVAELADAPIARAAEPASEDACFVAVVDA